MLSLLFILDETIMQLLRGSSVYKYFICLKTRKLFVIEDWGQTDRVWVEVRIWPSKVGVGVRVSGCGWVRVGEWCCRL